MAGGIFSLTVSEERGRVATPADLDALAIVIGCSSAGSGLSSFFITGTQAVTECGYGDAVDVLTQTIEQRQQGQPEAKRIAAMYKTPDTTPGSYGAIDNTGMIGTSIPAVNSALEPFGTYDARFRIVDPGTVGTTGATYQTSLDGGRNWSNITGLGTATAINIPNSGAGFLLGPSAAQATVFVALAVEMREEILDHLSNVTAHDSADTSAAQIALLASPVPTTQAMALTTINLCRTTYESHRINTTVHNGPDPVNLISRAAATDVSSGIALAIEIHADFNLHLGIALVAAVAGLKAATATVAAPVILTTADLLDAGELLLLTYPRRLTFTTAGATAASAPPTVAIVGTDLNDAAASETLALAQTAALVRSVNSYKTITSITYAAADDVDATVAIGYELAVHNSADVTNLIGATDPVQGTLLAADVSTVRTFAPASSVSDIDAAFVALADSSANCALIILAMPCDAAMAAHVTTGLNLLRSRKGRICSALVRSRDPDLEAAETITAWKTSIAADFLNFNDSRITPVASFGLLTDAMTTRAYLRSPLAQLAADTVRRPRGEWPDCPADRPMPNFTLIDSTGAFVGHDEGPGGLVTGLSNDTLGNRFWSTQRLPVPSRAEEVFSTVPWVLYSSTDQIKNLPTRRLCNAIEREAIAAGVSGLGGKLFFTRTVGSTTTGTLTPSSRKLAQSVIYQALASQFASEIDNAGNAGLDNGLVQIQPGITIRGGNLIGISGRLAPSIGGFVVDIALTLSIQE